jgi:cytoskeletal protein RodZ
VKTRIQSLFFLATLAFAMMCWGGALQAQNTPSTTPDRQAQQPDTTPPQSTPETQTPSSQSQQTPDTAPPPSSRTPESGAQQSGSADSGAAAGTQTFSGTVVKQGDKYVLKDDSGKTYDIDHQDEVKKFDGKRVRVQGTLDPSTNTIMVK